MSIGLAVALLGMTLLAIAGLLLPLLWRGRPNAARDDYNLAVYRDQLAEVERDVARGLLGAEQAAAARAEIGRRMLSLAPAVAGAPPASSTPAAIAAMAIVILPFAAWTLYARLGSPALPDQPFAERAASEAASNAPAPGHDMAEALAKLAAHLSEHPDDLTGWLLLARSEMSLDHFGAAEAAYRHAVETSGRRPDILADWAEAQVIAAGGTVTPEARQAFEDAVKDQKSAPRARYYLGLAELQHGNAEGALRAWVDLEADSPPDAEWLSLLRRRIAETAATLGLDPATLKTSSGASRPVPASAAASGAPDSQKVREAEQALGDASPQDRQAMIAAMVARLAARLEQHPEDPDGWARLGRAYMVLHEPDKARGAYARALKLKPDEPELKQAYAEAITAAGDPAAAPPAEAVALFRQVLAGEPQNPEALWYVGLAEADAGHNDAAYELWTRLLAGLPANAPGRSELERRLATLKPAPAK